MKQFGRYMRLWVMLTINSFLISLTTRFNASIFLIAKILRFSFFFIFLVTLFSQTKILGEYRVNQMIFFFLTFNIIDTVTQLFFREVYRFRPMVVSGDFDLVLIKPYNPLFRALVGGADPLDLMMLVPYVIALAVSGSTLGSVTMLQVVTYILLVLNGLLIATGFHIIVLALAVLTTEIDHAVMIYRDITSMGRIPVDLYREPLRGILTFVLPVGVMMSFPAKAMMGLLSPWSLGMSLVIGFLFFLLCMRLWNYALTQYASASS